MIRYAATIFLSAFLLFQVQPMVARFILPWFGGSSLVWTTCMLFFQVALVLGYAYSHLITNRLSPAQQLGLHAALLVIAIVFLPIKPDDFWKPADGLYPTWRILVLLTVSVGLPFFLLSTTGPLIQAWQATTHPHRSPFRLFALSNFGSLLALISYPFVFEPFFSIQNQSWTWSFSFGAFAVLAFLSGWQFRKKSVAETNSPNTDSEPATEGQSAIPKTTDSPGLFRFALWLILPMLASIQLLATTNLMTQEIGSMPFLWILPLSLYLISFIICFDHDRWYIRGVFFPLLFASTIFAVFVQEAGPDATILAQIVGYSLVCFAAAMCCHGELARIKPGADRLTLFYLMVSIGGALGGVFVAVIAPRIFVGYYEFQIGLLFTVVLCLMAFGIQVRSKDKVQDTKKKKTSDWGLAGYAVILFLGLLVAWLLCSRLAAIWSNDNLKNIVDKRRNAYGTLTVKEYDTYRKLNNGRIEHGLQCTEPGLEMMVTSYYSGSSGLGVAIDFLRSQGTDDGDSSLDLATIGLGVGTVCAWAEPGDTVRFYEINPAVEDVAREYFSYLEHCASEPEIVMGDARLQLERELREQEEPRKFDILVADAFSSDSIPMHLLTLEAMQIYKARLTEDGILCVHTSNRFLRLENIVKVLAEELGMQAVRIDDSPEDYLFNNSTWVLVTNNTDFVDYVVGEGWDGSWPNEKYSARWTDDFASIVPVVKLGDQFEWVRELLVEKGWLREPEEEEEKEDE
ncbi:MAG: fused MFS/spermidine synthase [Pirellulaceae bacterium]